MREPPTRRRLLARWRRATWAWRANRERHPLPRLVGVVFCLATLLVTDLGWLAPPAGTAVFWLAWIGAALLLF